MLEQDIIELEKVCPECERSKYVLCPEWQNYLSEMRTFESKLQKGYTPRQLMLEWDKCAQKRPEAYPCNTCDGIGTVLTEKGERLVRFLQKYMKQS